MTKTTAKETHPRGAKDAQGPKDAYIRERLATPTDLKADATRDISAALAGLLADVFALYSRPRTSTGT